MKNLNNHVAIISGALGDIGRAIALELAARGAHIALGDILPDDAATSLLSELEQRGVRACYHRVDVADDAAVFGWVEAVERELGTPDLIVPNAAIVTMADICTVTPAQWRRELAINLDGAFYLAQSAAQQLLRAKKPGRIVFIGSWAAHRPHPPLPTYAVAKAGLRMLMQSLAIELAPHDILVNEVAPGYVDAGLSGKIFDEQPAVKASSLAKVPVRRLIAPADVAFQVAHLCDPENRHTTGSVVLMDGGLSLLS